MNRKNKKFLVLILAITMIFSGIGTAFADDTAGSVTNAYQEFGPFGSSWWSFGVSSSTFSSSDAICAEWLNLTIPTIGQSVTMQKLSATDERTKLAYYAYLGHNQTMEDRWHLNQCASKLSGHGSTSTSADNYYNEAMKVTVPANFEAYYCDPTNGSQAFLAWNMAPMGKMNLKKVSANPAISDKSSCYSLENAEYGVYKTKADAEKDTNKVASLITNTKGESNTIEIAPATYFVKERKASKGYALDKNIYLVTVQNGKAVAVNGGTVKEVPQNDPVRIIVGKIDKETTKEMAQGGATFEGAEFEVIYQDAKPQPRVWRFKTDEKGRVRLDNPKYFVSGDELYYAQTASGKTPVFPLGKYTIQEKVAPNGYNVDDTVYTVEVTGNNSGTETVETYNAPIVKEQVKRYNLDFIKVEDGTQKRMANVPFLLTCVETGESHVIVTDENGQFNTQMADFMANTNKNDEAYDPKTGKVDDSKLSPEYGLWFGQDADGNTSKAYADAKGNIVYGTYTLTELSSKANKGHKLLKDIEIKFNKSKDGYEVRMGTLTNDWSSNQPKIGTTLTDEGNNKLVAAAPNTKLVDKVAYSGWNSLSTCLQLRYNQVHTFFLLPE